MMELNPNAEMWKPPPKQGSPRPSKFSPRSVSSPRLLFSHEDPQLERNCNRPMSMLSLLVYVQEVFFFGEKQMTDFSR